MIFASAGDLTSIKKLIAEFYYTTPDKITFSESGQVVNNGKVLKTVITQRKKRYYFGTL